MTTPPTARRVREADRANSKPRVRDMTVYYRDERITVYHGDCLEVLARLPAQSVDAVVTDPPYGLEFMGHDWERPWAVSPASSATFAGRHDLLLPIHRDNRNANCRACGGRQRGKKRCRCAIPQWDRDPRKDLITFQMWCQQWASACLRVLRPGGHLVAFGGARTWHRLACAVEDAGFEIRDTVAWLYATGFPKNHNISHAIAKASSQQDERGRRLAQQWSGWGTALKPGFEPILIARKPPVGTVAETVLAYRTGGLNIDATRIRRQNRGSSASPSSSQITRGGGTGRRPVVLPHPAGRWPTNIVLTHAPECTTDGKTACVPGCPVADLNQHSGTASVTGRRNSRSRDYPSDADGPSRYFPVFRWQPKARASQRPTVDGTSHPTVKPVDLMRWLACLVTPPGGTIVDPFLGSGTTAEAARVEGFHCIGIERDPKYLSLITARLRSTEQSLGQDAESEATDGEGIAA